MFKGDLAGYVLSGFCRFCLKGIFKWDLASYVEKGSCKFYLKGILQVLFKGDLASSV